MHSHIQSLEPRQLLSAADLDPTFGTAGVVTANFGVETRSLGIVRQTSGKIVAAAEVVLTGNDHRFWLVRYNEDGTPDPTFGMTAGHAEVDVPDTGANLPISLTVDSQNRLLVAIGNDVYRFGDDGTLPGAFAGDGSANAGAAVQAIAVDSADRVYAVTATGIRRFTTAGVLDTGFSGDGVATFSGELNFDIATTKSLIVDSTDRPVFAFTGAAGSPTRVLGIGRITTAGTADTTFSTDGQIAYAEDDLTALTALAIQSDGKIIAGGSTEGFGFLARFAADGTIDSTFGTTQGARAGGLPRRLTIAGLFPQLTGNSTVPYVVSIQGPRILATGLGNDGAFVIALNDSGQADVAFSGTGIALLPGAIPSGIAQITNGSIVLASTSGDIFNANSTPTVLTLAKTLVNGDPTRPAMLSSAGSLNLAGTAANDNATVTYSGSSYIVDINEDRTTFAAGNVKRVYFAGRDGNDSFTVNNVPKNVQFDGDVGNDTMTGTVNKSNVLFNGGDGDDTLNSNGNKSTFTFNGNAGNDTLIDGFVTDLFLGGPGLDTADFRSRTVGVNVSLDAVANDGVAGESDNIGADVEQLFGGSGGDYFTGNAAANIFRGFGGDDVLIGLAGDDRLLGDAGSDRLYGGLGKDRLSGGNGKDKLFGESENDRLYGGLDNVATADNFADQLFGGSGTKDTGYVDSLDILSSVERKVVVA